VRLHVRFVAGYPRQRRLPRFSLVHQMLVQDFPADGADALLAAAREAATEALASADSAGCVYDTIAAINAAIADGRWRGGGGGSGGGGQTGAGAQGGERRDESQAEAEQEGCVDETAEEAAATARLVRDLTVEALESVATLSSASLLGAADGAGATHTDGAKALRGNWQYRVGLVGKPSAGKSSLFNALTRARARRDAGAPMARPTAEDGAGREGEADGEGAPDVAPITIGWGEQTAAAKVGATPFTTIEPNIGEGRFAPAEGSEPAALVDARTPTAYGRATDGRRLLPCTLIDVAGLVPGAYTGRGKGNQFLADLCTADALVHVVDASGMTDSGGNPTERAFAAGGADHSVDPADGESPPADPDGNRSGGHGDAAADEIEWVGREIHLWVHSNVCAKRPVWRKNPGKLSGMFTGYGCSPLMVDGVLRRAAAAALAEAQSGSVSGGTVAVLESVDRAHGRGERHAASAQAAAAAAAAAMQSTVHGVGADGGVVLMARMAAESDRQLHRLVAHFVAARWPIAVALNKADHPGGAEALAACRRRYPQRVLVPTSARGELEALAACEQAGRHLTPGCGLEGLDGLLGGGEGCGRPASLECARRAITAWGSTGVLEVISRCVALRPPTLCYPVSHLGTLAPLTVGGGVGGSAPPPLRDCILLKPLSTVGDCFFACKRLQLSSGDFVRAEGRAAASEVDLSALLDDRVGGSGGVSHTRAAASAATGGGTDAAHIQGRPVKKDDVLSKCCAILRLQSTRKSQWQQR
jgi:ribosome-binding ATPase YchF (GTP1/OBG family)